MDLSLDHAFEAFARLAAAASLRTVSEAHPKVFGSRFAVAGRDKAQLRLVWDGKEQYLSLEISHGPDAAARAGWIELYGATCPGGRISAKDATTELDDAIEYGIELLSSAAKNT